MARRRREPATPVTDTTPTETTTTPTTGVRKMAGLTPEQIQTLLGKTRQKGIYIQYLNEFLKSGESGVCANDEWVALRDKKDTTLKQGFENARGNKEADDGSDKVKVLASEGKVYLINLALAGVEDEAEAA